MSGLTDVFNDLLDDPSRLTMDSFEMKMIEKFVVLQYSKSCGVASVNEARCILFTKNLKGLDAIPPTKNALYQHVRRALLQASFIWVNCLKNRIVLPPFAQWGWKFDETRKLWKPFWTDLADVSKACELLIKCGCKVVCRGRCKCANAGKRCTALCFCEGGCINNNDD